LSPDIIQDFDSHSVASLAAERAGGKGLSQLALTN
jgi:hypothetical protein